jgi:SAM-dependent methyltransferase
MGTGGPFLPRPSSGQAPEPFDARSASGQPVGGRSASGLPVDARRLGAEFGREAKAYAANRPGYPHAAVEWLAGGEPRDILDLGAGSGSLTASLGASGQRVVAAEPSRALLIELGSATTDVPRVQSRAESLPFAPGRFDIVTVATAFHWFDAGSALREIAAVLRPKGRLALVWNSRTEHSEWQAEFGELLRGAQPADLGVDWGPASVAAVADSALFGELESAEFPFDQRLDRAGLVGLAATRSYVIALPAARRRRLLDSVGRLFDAAAGGQSTVDLAYSARCWRATRTPVPIPGGTRTIRP